MNSQRYIRLRSEDRCVMCGEQDVRTIRGKCLCENCNQRRKEYMQHYYSENKDKIKQKQRISRSEIKSQGICPRCLKRTPENGKIVCRHCIEEVRNRRNKNEIIIKTYR